MDIRSTGANVVLGACLTLGFGVVSAAEPVGTLSRIEGTAFVSQGAQYVPGREGMALNEGDRVMVMDGGNAIISFTDGCAYSLADNEVLSLGATSTCASESEGSYKVESYAAAPQGPANADSSTPDSVRFARGQIGGGGTPDWLPPTLGGLSIAGLIAAGASQSSDRASFRGLDRRPPSP
jgi:hypothetical protein